MEEVWKPVKDFEGYYEVSNLGKLRSVDRYVKAKRGGKDANIFFAGKEHKTIISKGTRFYERTILRKNGIYKSLNIKYDPII